MQDERDNRILIDENGDKWLTDRDGNLLKDECGNNIPPSTTSKSYTASGFSFYDDSQGHCPLCGSLYCRGNCFK